MGHVCVKVWSGKIEVKVSMALSFTEKSTKHPAFYSENFSYSSCISSFITFHSIKSVVYIFCLKNGKLISLMASQAPYLGLLIKILAVFLRPPSHAFHLLNSKLL